MEKGYLIKSSIPFDWMVSYYDGKKDDVLTFPVHPNDIKYCEEKYSNLTFGEGKDVYFKIIKDSLVEFHDFELPYNDEFAKIIREKTWDDIKVELYVGERNYDDYIDAIIGTLIKSGYLPPQKNIN